MQFHTLSNYCREIPDTHDQTNPIPVVTRHKERKFGKSSVAQWTKDRAWLIRKFAVLLHSMDNMLSTSPFLVVNRPLFVDYDLYGILGSYHYSGKTKLPALKHLRRGFNEM
jgi:glutathione S-transferase